MKNISRTIAGTAIATILGVSGLGVGIAAAAPATVPVCNQFSHPTLVSPTEWGCAAPSNPQLDRLGLPGSAGLPGDHHHHVVESGHAGHAGCGSHAGHAGFAGHAGHGGHR